MVICQKWPGFVSGVWQEFLTLLELFQALKRDLELVVVGEPSGVVEDIDPKKRHNRHGGRREGNKVGTMIAFSALLCCLFWRGAVRNAAF